SPSLPAKWPPAKKLAGFLAARIFLAVYFGGPKIRPPSWPVKWPQKTVRILLNKNFIDSSMHCNILTDFFLPFDEFNYDFDFIIILKPKNKTKKLKTPLSSMSAFLDIFPKNLQLFKLTKSYSRKSHFDA
ncbi:hypothetical protein BpHYR1_006025, partial [Brachionus plicatilis]